MFHRRKTIIRTGRWQQISIEFSRRDSMYIQLLSMAHNIEDAEDDPKDRYPVEIGEVNLRASVNRGTKMTSQMRVVFLLPLNI